MLLTTENKKILSIIELDTSYKILNIEHLTIAYLYELENKNIEHIMFQLHYSGLEPSRYELLKYGFVYPSEEKNLFYDKQIYHFVHTENEDIIVLQKHEFVEYNVSSIIRKLKIENLLDI